jgi:hypothetical protein
MLREDRIKFTRTKKIGSLGEVVAVSNRAMVNNSGEYNNRITATPTAMVNLSTPYNPKVIMAVRYTGEIKRHITDTTITAMLALITKPNNSQITI